MLHEINISDPVLAAPSGSRQARLRVGGLDAGCGKFGAVICSSYIGRLRLKCSQVFCQRGSTEALNRGNFEM